MPASGDLTLRLTDVRKNPIQDAVRIELIRQNGSERYVNREQVCDELTLTRIACGPGGLYRVSVAPDRYRSRQASVSLIEGRTVTLQMTFPVKPNKVKRISAPAYDELPDPLRRLLGKAAYEALRPLQTARLLNLAAKAQSTVLADGRSCLEHFAEVLNIDQDRALVRTSPGMERETGRSPAFSQVSGLLHPSPPGYQSGRSYKTRDPHGNLQLTFFQRPGSDDDSLVDADIDEARGIQHIFEVARNAVAGRTHPYNVREILIAGQGLDPGYSFLFA